MMGKSVGTNVARRRDLVTGVALGVIAVPVWYTECAVVRAGEARDVPERVEGTSTCVPPRAIAGKIVKNETGLVTGAAAERCAVAKTGKAEAVTGKSVVTTGTNVSGSL